MLFEAMKFLGVGVLIALAVLLVSILGAWLIDLIRARRVRHEEAERAKRMNEEALRRYMRGLAVLLLVGLVSCSADDPTAPTAVASPSPSPSPTPDPKTDASSCKQVDVRVIGYNGAGNPDLTFGTGEIFSVIAHPLNEAGAVLPANCRASTFATWLVGGSASCMPLGDRFSTSAAFWCLEPGTLSLVVRHGPYTSSWDGRIIR